MIWANASLDGLEARLGRVEDHRRGAPAAGRPHFVLKGQIRRGSVEVRGPRRSLSRRQRKASLRDHARSDWALATGEPLKVGRIRRSTLRRHVTNSRLGGQLLRSPRDPRSLTGEVVRHRGERLLGLPGHVRVDDPVAPVRQGLHE